MRSFDAWDLPAAGPDPGPLGSATVEPGGGEIRFPRWEEGPLRKLCIELRRGRSAGVEARTAGELATALGAVGSRFLDEGDPLRREALDLLPAFSGVSSAMAREVLDGMAIDWTAERLGALLEMELGDPRVLDEFRPDPRWSGRAAGKPSGESRVRALGPELSFHVCASTVPGVSVTSLIRALLVKSAVVLKPGRSDVVLPVLFVRGLREEVPDVAECVAVCYWPGGEGSDTVPERIMPGEADGVVVYGGDETVRDLRARTPVTRTFVAYRHRVGAALVGRDGLVPERAGVTARRVARAVSTFDQRGCVSPHVIYAEREGGVEPEEWSGQLAECLSELERRLPSGPLLAAEASEIQQLRGTWEMRAAAGEEVRVRHGGASPWTVLVEPEPGFVPSCTGRLVRVRPVPSLDAAVEELAAVGPHLQTVSLEGVGERRKELAESLARIGAVRITTARRSPWPPAWWHHDGGGPLRALLRWVDLEG